MHKDECLWCGKMVALVLGFGGPFRKKWTSTVHYWAKLASGEIVKYTEADAYQIEAAYKAGQIVPLSEEEWRQIVMRGKPNENQLK